MKTKNNLENEMKGEIHFCYFKCLVNTTRILKAEIQIVWVYLNVFECLLVFCLGLSFFFLFLEEKDLRVKDFWWWFDFCLWGIIYVHAQVQYTSMNFRCFANLTSSIIYLGMLKALIHC